MISILMPIYNGIEFIEESVLSIIGQTYDKWELLIGINGHSQNSEVYRTAKTFENDKIKVFDLYKIKGKSNTLNELVKYCQYDYVALLDVDDAWHSKKLEIQSELLNKYDIIGSNCIWFGDRPGIVPKIPVGDISHFNFAEVNPMINSSAIIRKELCFWNTNWDGVEDYDLWLRLRAKNKSFYNFKQILVKHRIHTSSAFNAKGNDNKVDNLLVSHGYINGRNRPAEINIPFVNKIQMNIG